MTPPKTDKRGMRSVLSALPVSFHTFGDGLERVLKQLDAIEKRQNALERKLSSFEPVSKQVLSTLSGVLRRLDSIEKKLGQIDTKLGQIDKQDRRFLCAALPILDQIHPRISFLLDERIGDMEAAGRFAPLGASFLENVDAMLQLPEETAIPVVFITDENYVEATRTAVCSLLRTRNPRTRYSVTVIGFDLSGESRLSFSVFGKAVRLLEPQNTYQHLVQEYGHVSKAALLKFDIATLFPASDKVLYLDSDILVGGDLTDLWQTDLSGKYAAVVKDYPACSTGHYDVKLGLPSYFNSGMMLLNTSLLRKEDMSKKLLDAKLNDPMPNLFMDQNAFNIAFAGNVVHVSPTYNLLYSNNRKHSLFGYFAYTFYGLSEREYAAIEEHPRIFHFANWHKPWSTQKADFYEKWVFETKILAAAEAQRAVSKMPPR